MGAVGHMRHLTSYTYAGILRGRKLAYSRASEGMDVYDFSQCTPQLERPLAGETTHTRTSYDNGTIIENANFSLRVNHNAWDSDLFVPGSVSHYT